MSSQPPGLWQNPGAGARESEVVLYLGAASRDPTRSCGLVATLQIKKLSESVGQFLENGPGGHCELHENHPSHELRAGYFLTNHLWNSGLRQ